MADTRVTLDTIVTAFQEGGTAEEIAQQYPALHLADVYSAIAYYLNNQPEVEKYLVAREHASAVTRQENEAKFDPQGVRDRLMARRQ